MFSTWESRLNAKKCTVGEVRTQDETNGIDGLSMRGAGRQTSTTEAM